MAQDYSKMTVATLRARLRSLELDSRGNKDVLIARLQEAEGDGEEEEKPKPTTKTAPAKKGRNIKKIDDDESDDEEEEEAEETKPEEAEEEEEEEAAAPVADNSMTVAQLKKLCKDRGLSTAGRKAELIERLNGEEEEGDDEEVEAAESAQTKKRTRAQMKSKSPPKRSTRAKKKPEPESESEEEEESSSEEAPAAKKTKNIGKAFVDKYCALANRGATVYADYDCMLNQTNIANNNNKFYVIQVVMQGGTYYTFTRWGRVGEKGQNKCEAGPSRERAIANFEKKFKQKTGNVWGQPFTPKAKLYTQIEMSYEDTEEMAEKLAELEDSDQPVRKTVTAPSKLDKPTQEFLSLIFNEDMFKEQMVKFDLDVKKMPLGQLSKKQIEEGYKVLTKLNRALESSAGRSKLETLTNEFYTKIPHSFGRTRPPLLADAETIRGKMEMLAVLGDIEIAVNLGEDADSKQAKKTKKVKDGEVIQKPNPLDEHYRTLKCDLDWVDPDSEEFGIVQTYAANTGAAFRKPKITNLWRTERAGSAARFAEHDDLDNRKLLWHGTNIAVVAAILNSGLRIMPHSGGRVGRGIYFASENGKSSAYVSCSGKTGVMFLGEAALGKEHHITVDDPSLRAAPAGYQSIVAKGRVEPDPSCDVEMEFNGHTVVVPTGKPVAQPEFSGSRFQNSEYLVYKESQAQLRYVMTVEFTR